MENSRKKQLRNELEKELLNVPDGQRIKIDNEVLEDLIFFVGKSKDGSPIKFPVWTGPFLSKIDLSELSFENVLFYNKDVEEIMNEEELSRFWGESNSVSLDFNRLIDFSNTNIVVDFSKVFLPRIENASFKGVDLSNSNIDSINYIRECDFSKTGIKPDFTVEDLYVGFTDFSQNDFSYVNINSKELEKKFKEVDLSNTGLNIEYPNNSLPNDISELVSRVQELTSKMIERGLDDKEAIEAQELDEKLAPYSEQFYYQNFMTREINSFRLDGCYINGELVSKKMDVENLDLDEETIRKR